jgi:serine/threonine protein kinase
MSASDPDGTPATAVDVHGPLSASPRTELTRYELGEAIGRGGMGEVRDALDRQIGRRVAIKTIRSAEPSERAIARFFREARIQGRLEHPAIPAVHELGTDREGRPYFVMKKLAGTTLARLLKRREDRPTLQRLLRGLADVCLAVELAHVHGVVHRDLKPDNIVIGDFGEVYVLDWGVAKVIGEDDSFDDISGGELETRAGAVLGTPGYMAPEQGRGEPDIDARVDVFSLGVMLREILECETEAPPELRVLAEQATHLERASRLPSARSLADGVQRYLDGDRDLELRRELARQHLALAQDAFARGGSADDRAMAMREAGRAVALDPQLPAAGDLMSRLMLEPPAETPPAVKQQMHDDAVQRTRALARGAMWGFVPFAGFLPWILMDSLWALPLLVATVLAFGVTYLVARRASEISLWWAALVLAVIVAICARLFSPTLIAPGMAVMIAGALATNPLLGSRQASVALWGLMSAAVLVPLAGARLGLITPTMEAVVGRGILIHTPMIASTATSAGARGALFILVVIGATVIIAYVMRRDDEEMRRRLHLQAWHVRQLFPDRP